ncbi:lysyl-tRNA synthetase [Cladophialophora chaetospira]|uniref:Lysine--tRNA ligase n=1 Tax=Cladophialophora chaetospira TaxID=386627 RepID=A0AA39CFZ9_9EURO|nr:lysyl-tRNA synthetase [Cladophialophora chaetospira]
MADATASIAQDTANLHLDEVTGERVSKSELKKRTKQREQAEKKKAKATTASEQPAAKKKEKEAEVELTPNQYHEIRSRQVRNLLENRDSGPNPYPLKFHVNTDIGKFLGEYAHLQPGEFKREVKIRIAGRVRTKRAAGPKLVFYDIVRKGVKIQILCQAQEATSDFEAQHEHLHRGDIVGVVGYPGRSAPRGRPNEGELSVFAHEVVLLTPCLHQLPDASGRSGELNVETRFRNRPLDFILNNRSRETIILRAKIIDYIRQYFKSNEFVEVETPILNQIAGGATAKPFITFINEYKMDMFMRIAPELYLKELLVGDFDRVFEIGKLFRNEGADLTHNPEFTTCEFYEAYADFNDVRARTEELVSGLVKEITGGYETTYTTLTGEEFHINWAAPWKRIDMLTALEEATGEKFPPGDELHTDETNTFLKNVLKKVNVVCPPPETNARMLDKLVGEFIEETCINPTFIQGHPKIMSPLAKDSADRPGITERFEAFVAKKEIANAYTELNNPFEQRARFAEQARQKAQGDDEAQAIDEAFLNALEYGLPPTGGWGMGIDRLTMFLTNHHSIREVLAFPFMKDETKNLVAGELPATRPAP